MVTHRVQFEHRCAPGHLVEIVGDVPDWQHPVTMQETTPGVYRCVLSLEPGIHRYKFRVDKQHWMLDEDAAVDDAEGVCNNIVSVGGVCGPVFFAPDRRHVRLNSDGTFELHAEVDADAPMVGGVWFSSGGRTPFHVVGRSGRRVFVQARAPLPKELVTRGGRFGFELQPGSFPLPSPRAADAAPPSWLRGAVFYAIFVDRWLRGGARHDERAAPRHVLSAPDVFYGGDLDGIRESLGYIQSLGANAIVLTPIHLSETPHRYDATDLTVVDERLGGREALVRLVEASHARGLKVVLDASVTHVHEDHAAFQDLLRHQEASRYRGWFRVRSFPVRRRDASTYDHYYNNPQLPWLDLRGAAGEHVLQALESLVDTGIDGLRLDAMEEAPAPFWSELRTRLRRRRADLLFLGEVVSDRPSRFAEARGLDVATDFQHREAMLDFFARRRIDAAGFWETMQRVQHRLGPFSPEFRLAFLDNHDTRRFMSEACDFDRLRLALTWLLTRPEPVWLTYGTEAGLFGGGVVKELDAAWTERIPMPPLDGLDHTETFKLIRTLAELRRSHDALSSPHVRLVAARGGLLVVDRPGRQETLRVFVNAGMQAVSLDGLVPQESRVLVSTPTNPRDPSTLPSCGARVIAWPAP